MWHIIAKNIIETFFAIAAAIGAYAAARWLMGISTPKRDIAEMQTWRIFNLNLKWYRGLEYIHQLKARNLLRYEA